MLFGKNKLSSGWLGRTNKSRLNLQKNKSGIFTYKREAIGILLIALFVILALSLVSYNPMDRSWFYYSSKDLPVKNWIGAVGAHASALFFYLFGSPAYIFIFILLFLAYLILFRKKLAQEYDRLLALCLLLITFSTLFRAYLWDFTNSFPGGLVGNGLYKIILPLLGTAGTKVLLFALIWIGSVALYRVSIFKALRKTGEIFYKIMRVALIHLVAFLKVVLAKLWNLILSGFKKLRKKDKDDDNSGGSSGSDFGTWNIGRKQEDEEGEKKETKQKDDSFWESMQDFADNVDNDVSDGYMIQSGDMVQNISGDMTGGLFREKQVFTAAHKKRLGQYELLFLQDQKQIS